MSGTETPSVSVWLLRKVLETLAVTGAVLDDVLARAGLPPRIFAEVDSSIPEACMKRVWEEAAAATNDPWFGLHFAEDSLQNADLPCYYLMETSVTVGQSIVRFVRYAALCIGGTGLSLSIAGSEARLGRRSTTVSAHGDEFLLALIVLRSRQATGIEWKPTHVVLQHDRPEGIGELARVFGCPVAFGGDRLELCFESEVLEVPHIGGRPPSNVLGLVARCADELDGKSGQASCVLPVASTIAKQLTTEVPTLASTARKLRITERTLQRRLAGSGSSYSQLLDGVRHALAIRLLREGRLSVTQVGFLLHFADDSAFHRAFKRWTGMTPGQYRRHGEAEPTGPTRESTDYVEEVAAAVRELGRERAAKPSRPEA